MYFDAEAIGQRTRAKLQKGEYDEDGDYLMPVLNYVVIFSCSTGNAHNKSEPPCDLFKLGHFATNVNFYHVRIPVNLTAFVNTSRVALQKIKAQNRNVYTSTMGELRKNVGYNQCDSLSEAIA